MYEGTKVRKAEQQSEQQHQQTELTYKRSGGDGNAYKPKKTNSLFKKVWRSIQNKDNQSMWEVGTLRTGDLCYVHNKKMYVWEPGYILETFSQIYVNVTLQL